MHAVGVSVSSSNNFGMGSKTLERSLRNGNVSCKALQRLLTTFGQTCEVCGLHDGEIIRPSQPSQIKTTNSAVGRMPLGTGCQQVSGLQRSKNAAYYFGDDVDSRSSSEVRGVQAGSSADEHFRNTS